MSKYEVANKAPRPKYCNEISHLFLMTRNNFSIEKYSIENVKYPSGLLLCPVRHRHLPHR